MYIIFDNDIHIEYSKIMSAAELATPQDVAVCIDDIYLDTALLVKVFTKMNSYFAFGMYLPHKVKRK